MRRFLAFCFMFASSAQSAPAAPVDAALQTQLTSLTSGYAGGVALFAVDLKTGRTVALNADTPVPTASTIKLAILWEAVNQIREGRKHWNDPVVLTHANQVEGSGVLTLFDTPVTLTLKDVLTMMIVVSDNTATNVAIDNLGLANINARITQLGLKQTWLYKKVFMSPGPDVPADQPAFGLGKTTAREMATLMRNFATCEDSVCNVALEMLKNQQDRGGIPRYLGDLTVANKSGALDASRNDVGIVYAKNGPIVISAYTYANKDQSWTPDNAGQLLIAKMSQTIVDAWQ